MKEKILPDRWFLKSSKELDAGGEKISCSNFSIDSWCKVTVPGTVIGGLCDNKVYDDPFYGTNMKSIPGYKHERTTHFAFHRMPENSPFRKPWWYRAEFNIENTWLDKKIWLRINGVNYSANIWINGKRIAGSGFIAGTFRRYDLDITAFCKPGAANAIAFEVFAQQPDDLGFTFIDWSPVPPDDSMGLWQPVFLYATGCAAIKNPFVKSELNKENLDKAELFISAEVVNTSEERINGVLECVIDDNTFTKEVELQPFEKKLCSFVPEEYPQLVMKCPKLWWPWQMGEPYLYEMKMKLTTGNGMEDSCVVKFGIRNISTKINRYGSCQFSVNGRELLIRGAAWAHELLLRQSDERDVIDIAYLKNMNMNAVRLEGMLGSDNFWDVCDREGILVLAGWPCCTHWENWEKWKPDDFIVAKESMRSQILRLRNHPCLALWLYGSDYPPPVHVEKIYIDVLKELHKELPLLSNATATPSAIMGKTGVKMSGPYTYVPPVYWYDKEMPGCAQGFNTETGPDVSIPLFENLKRFLPENQLFQGSESWNHHSGLAAFTDTNLINERVEIRYGKSIDTEDFVKSAQVMSYESWRAMYEAYTRNYPESTGVIGWMLNGHWPSVLWQLYDYYLQPTGGFFGAKKACEPLHVQYSYDDGTVWIVNSLFERFDNLNVKAAVYSFDLEKLFDISKNINVCEYERKEILKIPEFSSIPDVYFVFLYLYKGTSLISRNCYWLSNVKDILSKPHGMELWYSCPVKQHGDMSQLRNLPKCKIESSYKVTESDGKKIVNVILRNASDFLAFFVRVNLHEKITNRLLAPVFWNDNCVTLLPGERCQLVCSIPEDSVNGEICIVVDSWN